VRVGSVGTGQNDYFIKSPSSSQKLLQANKNRLKKNTRKEPKPDPITPNIISAAKPLPKNPQCSSYYYIQAAAYIHRCYITKINIKLYTQRDYNLRTQSPQPRGARKSSKLDTWTFRRSAFYGILRYPPPLLDVRLS